LKAKRKEREREKKRNRKSKKKKKDKTKYGESWAAKGFRPVNNTTSVQCPRLCPFLQMIGK
jgi:hypothetical protein